MTPEVLHKVTGAGAAAIQLGTEFGRMKETVNDTLDDAVNAGKRAVKQTRRAAEELVDDAQYQVKKHPLSTVGASFGIGLGLGAAMGILLARFFKRDAVKG